MSLFLEPPYDRGYPWKLVAGSETAVVSELAAVFLAAQHNVPIGRDGKPGKIKDSPLGLNLAFVGPLKISNKARRLLEIAGVLKARS